MARSRVLLALFAIYAHAHEAPAPAHSDKCTLAASGTDDSPAIERAFRACADVLVPDTENLLIGTRLNTTGLARVHIRLRGNLTLKPDVDYWRDNAFNVSYQDNSAAWLFGGRDVVLDGEGVGTIDGNGQTFYDARIENASLRPPHLMLAYQGDNVIIRNLKIRQSPRWTILVHSSKNLLIHDLDIRSRSNTWALGRESNRETDGPNATHIYVSNLWCNGTHGVSVGSLGENVGVKDIVANVYVNNVTIRNSENGARIVFSNFWHENNDSPITIDNCYKTDPDVCLAHPSDMTISNVYFTNQHGTASGKYGNIGAALVCSERKCTDIYLNNVNVTAPTECGPTVYTNHHVNVQGNAAYQFAADAPTYGAGGINPDNTTVGGVTCQGGQVLL
ncbi:pectin lyase fold/virulence factor [Mycena rosella]|uniref:galacturonan 1,4-alpha-galacturonidase n=1 Tax=Mycena rosella TaxID=1033263 RepID=A0AAD7MBK6_MYCRO|nr:pectin lyase fold/virulence factor [Mycena rosella]